MAMDVTAAGRPACAPQLADDRRRHLDAAMQGVTNIIAYVASRQLEMDADLVRQLVILRDAYIADRWQTADEQAFWPAYHTFVACTGVPIDALIFSRRWTRCIAWGAALLSIVVLVLLVAQLSFWAGLDSTVRQIDTLDGEMGAARDRLRLLTLQGKADTGLPTIPAMATPANAPRATDASEPPLQARAERDALTLDLQTKCVQLMALHKVLSERVGHESFLLLSKHIPDAATMPDSKDGCETSLERTMAIRAYVMGNARILRQARQDYVLPLLFGLLGTIAYLLRSLAEDIRDSRLTVTGLVSAGVRIPLGMLAGLAIGWVQGEQHDGVLNQLGPWALAFVAGYSVELVFAAMDRIIDAFTGTRTAAADSTTGSGDVPRAPG